MMKHIVRLLILTLPFLFALVGCNSNTPTTEMSNDDMLKVLDVKINKHPQDAELLYERAKIYLELNRVNDAIADLSRATSINNKEYKYFMLLGDAYFANGDVEHSYSSLQRALELKPESAEAFLKLGEIAYYSRDYDRAMEHLSKVTAKDPNNRTALFMKGFIYKETGDTSNAILLLRKVCDLYPDYEPAFEELGVLYSVHHNPMAVEYLNAAHQLEPTNTNALYALAMYYQEGNKIDQAEDIYKRILDIDDQHKLAWHNRGYIQLFTYGDYPLAIEYLTRAIQTDSTFIEAWANRACAYELNGNKEQARHDFQHALELDHTFQPAIDGLARIH
ncbi:MAG: tetratricopeptide repeat protein [Bacteroidales bacterium]|nr:tetratricopeptide repeat protein [Bacteroidales bacterium]